MFKLNLVAVLGRRRRRRAGVTLPDHIPGRPVRRLRQWAARARGPRGDAPPPALPAAEAPFPSEKVYSSRDGDLEDDIVYFGDDLGGEASAADEAAITAALAAADAATSSFESQLSGEGPSGEEIGDSSASESEVAATAPPLLDCRVEVALAVKVPTPLRVVPNALLGAAGSLLSRTVLKAVLPNFLALLAADFKDWAGGGRRRRGAGGAGGGLFAVPQESGQAGPVVHDVEVVDAAGAVEV